MNERIKSLLNYLQHNNIFPEEISFKEDPFDENYPEPIRHAIRITDYMLAQNVYLHEASELAGLTYFLKAPAPTNLFPRAGHVCCGKALAKYYNKPVENLCTMEWQHSNPDLAKVLKKGLRSYYQDFNKARKKYAGQPEHLNFLLGLELFIQGLEQRIEQYRSCCMERSYQTKDPQRKRILRKMAANLERVPMEPAESFEEAIQCVYICWQCLSDSLGRPDQYLYPYYKKDIEKGILTRDHAKELLQELFLMIYRYTPLNSPNDDKGAESHFVIGGYTLYHEDGFNELSELIMEAMMELPIPRPQVSLRWNKKTPFSVLKMMLDYERKDQYKRIAYVNDEPRIKAIMEYAGIPWEKAYDYIMTGCNEPSFQGGISMTGMTVNILRAMTDVFSKRKAEILECKTFDEFYKIFEKVLMQNLERALSWQNKFDALRSGDCNIMSSLFLKGCVERAQSATRGGAEMALSGWDLIGGTNLIDSLTVIRQFIFEEKLISMETMADALEKNWNGYEALRGKILQEGKFFGNNDDLSNEIARTLNHSLYKFGKGRTSQFGYPLLFGNLTGYRMHFANYGKLTGATPDGRFAGSHLTFGSGQTDGKDRNAPTSHLLSVAQWDPYGSMCGNTIMNLTMERETIENEERFDKMVHLIETFFKMGGLHIQLNYVSREDLIKAKADPQKYKNLRVRVSGFSALFVGLEPDIQDNIIARTESKI